MPGDREHLLSVARDVVSAGLRAPAGQERTHAALLAIRERVAPPRMDAFWVALIEHSINTLSPFLAVHGDELATQRGPSERAESTTANLPLDLVNDALAHASADDYPAVADTVHRMIMLDPEQRAVALGNLVHIALTIGEIVRGHHGGEPAAG
ncbi:MAG: hypothetical protein ABIQ18_06315 [Umezawaea sp.]